MKSTALALLTSLALCVAMTAPAQAQEKPLTRSEVEALVKKTIEENPELIMKSVQTYQIRKQAGDMEKASKNVAAMQGDLNNNPNSPSVGNPNGDVTVVEFFDYHCGYCKHFFPTINNIIAQDKNVKVVFKEFPILSPDSLLAARAALAVNSVDKSKYFAYHTALMKTNGAYTLEILTDKAKEVGIPADKFKKAMENPDIEKELDHNKELARSLSISGTPAMVVGKEIVPGAVDEATLKAKIQAAREKKS